MNTKLKTIPTTGKILEFLIECVGEAKKKGVGQSYNRIDRVVEESHQGPRLSQEVRDALIDAVAVLFDPSLEGVKIAELLRSKSFYERLVFVHESKQSEIPNLNGARLELAYHVVDFIERHQWHAPQFLKNREPDDALWLWAELVANYYSVELKQFADADTACAIARWRFERKDGLGVPLSEDELEKLTGCDPRLRFYEPVFESLPRNLSWNMPLRRRGEIKWPVAHAFDWWEDLLGARLTNIRDLDANDFLDENLLKYISNFRRPLPFTFEKRQPVPSLATIQRLAKLRLPYRGTFLSDPNKSLETQFKECRLFLRQKIDNGWLSKGDLYSQIGYFPEIDEDCWLNSPQPIKGELPVAEFIERVRRRYAKPSREKLVGVLLWCRALQIALNAVKKQFGVEDMWFLVQAHQRATASMNARIKATLADGENLNG